MTNCAVYLQILLESAKLVAETKGSCRLGTPADDAFRVNAGTDVTDAFVTSAGSSW